jgi:PTS system nitrogen regulatory IIA component
MLWTVREVARMLDVRENVLLEWVANHGLPAEEVNGQLRFNRAHLIEWATLHKIELLPALFKEGESTDRRLPRLDDALDRGGVFHDVPGADREAVLRQVVDLLPLPGDFDRDFLYQVLVSRETLGSTAIGHGLALPHPRYPAVLPVDAPSITLCFLRQPIPYGAPDSQLVHTLFLLISPAVPVHLQLLGRLSLGLRDPDFLAVVQRKGRTAEVLAQAQRLEETLQEH